ncbi:MAG TPA: DUF692 domain-containing protein [Candidatus Xenobia bacterium]|jgi:hypothetical protein
MSQNRWKIRNLGLGMGLRTVHYSHILESRPAIDFFEIISENYMDVDGRPMWMLDQVAERYPIIMHGVSMSIGSTDPLNMDYLLKLKALARRIDAPMVSDHLCFTGVAGRNVHDLLPVPYDEKTLRHVAQRVKQVQEILERPLMLENPSTYLEFKTSTMTEPEFMVRLMEEADCGMLLDVNNVYVSARNHGFDAAAYLEAIPVDRIGYHHLAGHTDKGTHLLDTHSDFVVPGVWDLYERISNRTGGRTTLVEWDENIPAFEVVHAEVLKARQYLAKKVHAQVA